jgi:Zn-finger nucleic acid-binding protein
MTGPARHFECPVCLGVVLSKLRPGGADGAVVDHCRRCGGLWLQAGELQRLRQLPPEALWQLVPRTPPSSVPACHDCHAPMARDAARCEGCGRDNTLECPECGRPLTGVVRDGVRLDVCQPCRGVWFDHHELDAIWRIALAAAVERRLDADPVSQHATILDALILTDVAQGAVWGLAHGGAAAADGLASVMSGALSGTAPAADVAAAAAEGAAAAVEIAGEAAGGVLETVLGILGGLFS